ncbi:hypothetical protein NW762_006584 [Fusarium torreyae]|uniref:NB-ARC domain-containing protein n=1 Tax=Fusarium torreyae TaxID=1237075 RepID=A0A9W8VEZ2_9HYPO|nr:hypothetical protein NW762_006584 [Fusarium torreyae]
MEELNPSLYTIAWIAPLEIEAQAALHMLDHRHNGRFPTSRGDDYVFRAGDINGHNIVVATLPAGQEYGTGSAAALASQIKKFFPNLWFGLLVGVAAGLPNLNKTPPIDIRLGDVIVGLPEGESAGLIAYDLGKETADGFQLLRFGRVLANTETVVRSAIGNIKVMAPYDSDVFLPFYETIKDKEHSKGTFTDPGQENDALYDVNNDSIETLVPRPKRDASRRTRVWYGPIGSGDKLTKNARKRNELRDRFGVIGLEMEAAGTMNRIPVGVIRGVCDYADEHKNKEWQPYAAAMAAAYAKAILHELGPGKAVSKQGNITPARHGTILCDLPPSTDRFFGRDKELSEMRTYLETSNQRKGVVLCGISGSGKTQLAREYVAQRGDQFSAVLWIDAGSEENIEQSMSSCASRICEGNPGFQKRRESTPPYQFIFEWLRTNSEKRWLVVVDNANDTIPNKRLLGPFHEMKHGALCVTSTQQVTARALRMKEMSVQRLDLLASQSLVLWRAYESDQDQTEEARDAARRVAKLLDGYPLALELAGSLHQRGITSLDEFSEIFAEEYPALAQFEIDSGAWSWTKAGASDSLFGILDTLYESLIARTPELAHLLTLCSIYGPQEIPISLLQGLELYDMNNTSGISNASKKLQSLVHSKVKLNKAIDELAKVFLVTKKQATDRSILGFSLHASICHWRFATMEDRDIWIIQAAYNLSRHISSGNATNDKYRFFNMFNRCLDAIWKHMEPCNIDPIHGEFASPYFTICSCGADMYLSMGKPYIAKKLFTAAIDYGRSSQASQISDHVILRLLNGLAECYEKMKQFEPAEEALLSATDMAERTLGHMDDLTGGERSNSRRTGKSQTGTGCKYRRKATSGEQLVFESSYNKLFN